MGWAVHTVVVEESNKNKQERLTGVVLVPSLVTAQGVPVESNMNLLPVPVPQSGQTCLYM